VINPSAGGGTAGESIGGRDEGGVSGGSDVNPNQFEGRPSLTRIGDKVAVVGEALTIQLRASDPQNDLISFSLRSALPDGAKFEKEIGLFTWTPVPDQVGRSFLLTFEVSDGMLKDQETIAIRVSAAGSQEAFPPEIDPVSDQLLTVGQSWTYQLVGEDPNGQSLVYRLDGSIPLGLTFDSTTGIAQWTPMAADVGRYDLRAGVSDGESEATTPMRLIVRDVNDQSSTNTPPVFNQLPPQQITAGETLTFELSAMDDMPMSLTYAAEMIPMGSEFNPFIQRFTWRPSDDQAGNSYDAVFLVSDGEFRSFLRVSIEVLRPIRDCPPDPAGMSGGSSTLDEGSNLTGRVICDTSEIDQYQITLDQEGILDITTSFNQADGDLDVFLYTSMGLPILSATGVTGEERMTSGALPPGTYRVDVKLYGTGGPVTYTIGYTTLDPTNACQADAYEGGSNNTEEEASFIPVNQSVTLNLCSGDVDYLSFEVTRGDQLNIEAIFRHMIADIDLRLIGPRDADGNPYSTWVAGSIDDNESILVESAPVTGVYILEVKTFESEREVSYDLRVSVTAPEACEEDRFEPSNNNSSSPQSLQPELYRDLTACVDEDWHSTQIDAGRSLILYLTYDAGIPIVTARGTNNSLPVTPLIFNSPVDGCLTDRAICKRYQIDPSPNGDRVTYSISFEEVGVEYDLRVRIGDEVGSPCLDDLDCNVGFSCYSSFDVFLFSEGLCAEECDQDSDCGGSRACISDGSGSNLCMQQCDTGLSCRPQFTCQEGIETVDGAFTSLCLSDEYDE
jgi:hypothetical protein